MKKLTRAETAAVLAMVCMATVIMLYIVIVQISNYPSDAHVFLALLAGIAVGAVLMLMYNTFTDPSETIK